MRQDVAFLTFNRGIVSRLGLARLDIKRIGLSAQIMHNYLPRKLGPMSIRPGMKWLGTNYNNAKSKKLPFIFSNSDKAIIELTDLNMRVWINDAVVTRPSVTSTLTNGTFNTDLSSWSDDDELGGTSTWVAPGYMQLVGGGFAAAVRTQSVTVAGGNIGVEHALRIVIARGPVTLRVGSTAGDDDYITETALDTGTHSLTLTPTGNFYIRLQSRLTRIVWVDSVAIESAGTMVVPAPWPDAALDSIRFQPSGDILFIACKGYKQYKIERRATRSWSVVEYQANAGPFRVPNIGPGTLTPSVTTGNGTLTSSVALFKPKHVGALFSVTSNGQTVSAVITAQNQFSSTIKVTGVGSDRAVTAIVTGLTATGTTITVQRSIGVVGNWSDSDNYSTDITTSGNDLLDNQIVYFRIGCKTGNYVAGTINVKLVYAVGAITGICRVIGYTSPTVVNMEVLRDFGGITATDAWSEGVWSDLRGYPSSVAIYDGRMIWVGKDNFAASVSDDFYNYDPDTVGDSGPIVRTIGSGPVDVIQWALPMGRLLLGGELAEFSVRSSVLDDPLTPTNTNIKPVSRQGSAAVDAVPIDNNAAFVARGGIRVFEMAFDGSALGYTTTELSALIPEIGKPGIVRDGLQRQPDTRLHFIRSDGSVAILVFDKVEQVTCWCTIDSPAAGGIIEDFVSLPGDSGDTEDHVYYDVKRTINGATQRGFVRMATQDECVGNSASYIADSCVHVAGPITTVTGLSHLEGEQVVVWADGKDVGHDADDNLIYTVSGGQITLAVQANNDVVVGLPYDAKYKSGRFAELQSQMGSAIKWSSKQTLELGVIMADTHRYGFKFGPDFDHLDDLPSMEFMAPVDNDQVWADYDGKSFTFPGEFDVDSRLCLTSKAPRPATILCAVCAVEFND